MFYVDTPTPRDLVELHRTRADACVSIYVPTTPHTQDVTASRIEFGNLAKAALNQLLGKNFDKRRLAALREGLDAVADDDDFWRLQARSLAVLATPERVVTFRLANRLSALSEVSDRFHLNPLLRAVAFPHEALVLAISENSVRLIEAFSDLPPVDVKVPDVPKDAASHAHKSTLNDRSPSGRIQGSEGQRVRHLQYLRAIDAALRPALAGRDTPLIVAAVDPLASLFPGRAARKPRPDEPSRTSGKGNTSSRRRLCPRGRRTPPSLRDTLGAGPDRDRPDRHSPRRHLRRRRHTVRRYGRGRSGDH